MWTLVLLRLPRTDGLNAMVGAWLGVRGSSMRSKAREMYYSWDPCFWSCWTVRNLICSRLDEGKMIQAPRHFRIETFEFVTSHNNMQSVSLIGVDLLSLADEQQHTM